MYKQITKPLCILISFGFILLSILQVFGDERVYDFSNDNAWEPIAANWEIIDGEYVVTADPDKTKVSIAVLKEDEGIDTSDVESIEVMGYDLGTATRHNALIVFGFDEHNPVSYAIGPAVGNGQTWALFALDTKTRVWPKIWLAEHKEILRALRWYHVKLVFDGDTIILYGAEGEDDLQEKLRYKFPDGKPSGRIGIGSVGSDAKFDDFRVTGPWTKSLAVVEPKDTLPMAWGKIKAGPGL